MTDAVLPQTILSPAITVIGTDQQSGTEKSTHKGSKLLIHPLLVALMLWLLPPFDPELELAALLIAAMPMMSIYPIIGGNYGYGSQCASILILTTALSFVTVTVLLAFVT